MNILNEENRLQDYLHRLEAGEPLDALAAELTAEERALLKVAHELAYLYAPDRGAETVTEQRQRVVDKAAAQAPVSPAPPAGWSGWRRMFSRPAAAWSAAALVALVLLAWGWWALAPAVEGPAESPVVIGLPAAADPEDAVAEAPLSAGERPAAAVSGGVELFLPVSPSPLLTAPGRAALHDVVGLVEIAGADGRWTAVTEPAQVAAGQRLRTGRLARAILTFHDGSRAEIGPSTELVLDELNALRPADGFRAVVMTQLSGETEHEVDHRGDAGSRYEVRTLDASGVARGTRFAVSIAANSRARYTVSEGRVDVSGAGRTVPVIAGQVSTVGDGEPPSLPVFTISGQGELSEKGVSAWVIAGQSFQITADTVILGEPQVGDTVAVRGHLAADGSRVADRIEKIAPPLVNRFVLVGRVASIGATSWTVGEQAIAVSATTRIDPAIAVGHTVLVRGVIRPGGGLSAESIALVATERGRPFEFAGPVTSLDPWVVAGVRLTVNPQTVIEDVITVGSVVRVRGLIQADGTWLATEIRLLAEAEARFTLSGRLTGINPWSVAGVPFTVNSRTVIDPGLALGDSVFVTGRILADGTWLAEVVEKIDGTAFLEIVFAGVVESIDPWIIAGLPLATDDKTVVVGAIAPGDLVRVKVRILPDGTWLALHIELLAAEEPGEGCVTLTAVVTALGNGRVTFSDGTSLPLDGVPVDGRLEVGSVAVIIACVDDSGEITIERIIVLVNPGQIRPTPAPGATPLPPSEQQGRVTICHKPGTPAEQTKTLPRSALGGHLGHGDTLGPCP